jgi:hypothetical protein
MAETAGGPSPFLLVATSPHRFTTFDHLRPAYSIKVGLIRMSEPFLQSKSKMINFRSSSKISNFLDSGKIKSTPRNKLKYFFDSNDRMNTGFSLSEDE